jgi:hypothetical protein
MRKLIAWMFLYSLAYEAMAGALPTADHPFTDILTALAQGRLLPDPEDGRVGQHHHRRW